ncbi:uncharacterized protein BDZ99DRAFT_459017 [Mytilinidion resinicola]|uniref:Lea domain protein n=1 Tax=Mytilinidion resinicola TaxID=574789 RepID=A0A6A6Z1N0_9PEZI|nr:uncharacterized protein BDZ99DRAFT_459017 [Mytilinidion resinicola]KAF2815072.1 hypothetical protein BDZ99DRAFT_459017 [Mytilinidion resinicola]
MSSIIRTSIARQARLFSTSPAARKSVTETLKEPLKKVDRIVSDAAVKGIETGEKVTEAAKSTIGSKSSEASGEASKLGSEASGKSSELTGEAKGKASELAGKAKGAKEEIKGKI